MSRSRISRTYMKVRTVMKIMPRLLGAAGVAMMIVAMLLMAPFPTLAQDVRRADDINVGPDLGGTGQEAINFTGSTGSAGDTWITVHDEHLAPTPSDFTGLISLSADVLIHGWNNKKGAGLVAVYNEAPTSKKGLALTLYSAGGTDSLVLATVDQAGKLVTLKTVRLGAAIAENVWYRVSMSLSVGVDCVSVAGAVFKHATPRDPNSLPTDQVGVSLKIDRAPLNEGALLGVSGTGAVGILAAAVSAAVSSSVTNISFDRLGIPEMDCGIFD
jgi:hypothetical protein